MPDFNATARRLWSTAPFWKASVIGGGVFAALSVIYAVLGPGSGGGAGSISPVPPPPPPPPVDRAVNADLAAYFKAVDKAHDVKGAGARCEAIAAAYTALSPTDIAAGRNILVATKSELKAIHEGEDCNSKLAESDAHFDTLAQDVAAVDADASPVNYQLALAAAKALDAFDQSRTPSAAHSELLSKVKQYSATLAASDSRIANVTSLAKAAESNQTPQATLQLASSFDDLTPFDKLRLQDKAPADFSRAAKAAATVRDARESLEALPALMQLAQSEKNAESERQLMNAVAAIGPLGLAIATPDQKASYDAASSLAASSGWSLLGGAVATFKKDPSPDKAKTLACLYKLLAGLPHQTATAGQQALLAEGQAATALLEASDARIATMLATAKAWSSSASGGSDAVLAAMQAITNFDKTRFDQADHDAYDRLAQAESIIEGPALGLNKATKTQVAIYVQPADSGAMATKIANTLADRLSAAGFQLVPAADQAALVVKTAILSESDPAPDLTSGQLEYDTTVDLSLSATWTTDGSSLLSTTVTASGEAQDQNSTADAALSNAVDAIVKIFADMVKK